MVSITYEKQVLVVKMEYDEGCIYALKERVPANMRQWDKDKKLWYVGLPYLDTLVRILQEYFDDNDIYLSSNIPSLTSLRDVIEPRESPYSDLYLLPNAPIEVAKAAYRALAKLYHPDTGRGDVEKMKRINLAWEAIRG